MNSFILNANDIAPFFVSKGVSPLKLQKLLYYSQVWFIKRNGDKLFTDPIRAWVFGPVVTSIWNKFKVVRRNDIIAPFTHFYPCPTLLPETIHQHLQDVWNSYGHLTGSELVDLTHSEIPWKMSRIGLLDNEPSATEIILDYNTISGYQLDHYNNIPYVQSKNTLGFFSS
ncbi:type II toxin-antitoxin system antitoxin SocA domain-containing protein [Sphingobacterium faecium]|uniref:Panacea domain-containing protein n=1 Tax=Sphingobacterium faecium TaxID=34087 RepID=UPI00320A20C1